MTDEFINPYDPKQNYGADPLRKPALQEGDEVVLDEPGRIIGSVTYQSHYLILVKNGIQYCLLVHHGGGQERINLPYCFSRADLIQGLGMDERYLFLYSLFRIHSEARSLGQSETELKYKQAFIDGRLKKRKLIGQDRCKVWIETIPKRSQA